ncbi:tricarballylate utilization protein B [Hartmannibacter diazotrophicus]|uniref:Tricarballylate utilization protein B n=1 Tax=Hartmannibacter diazotrophicus TaxID=1482074 RepID=A0A2C9D0P0_9HYPH|nr:tricarballylate utilization 4Fe-4S protein TcuB [Hartmannibacter diazotrophicus]SON53892.1 tricarballylate utilization protein B [Hartmannibacter diazotrophicus]
MHATETLKEAGRLMTVCNSCRYCEGLCAVFPAMELRRSFTDGDLDYLSNLCHSCGACYVDCQFSPPHEFDVNVPQTLALARAQSYARYTWPGIFSVFFERNGLLVSLLAAASVAVFILAFVAVHEPAAIFSSHAGGFYAVMPHNAMALLFGFVGLFALLAIAMSVRNFWREIGATWPVQSGPAALWQAVKDAGSLRYLDGGGVGCFNEDDEPTDRRRLYHHLTFYGFLLCFAATSVATLYHYLLGREAPYPVYDLPVLLGIVGGIGLLIGPAGLLLARGRRDPMLKDASHAGMDTAFLVMLFLTSLTGLALLALRETAAMPITLAVHLGVVFALFLSMPYGKFMHGFYRYAALVRYAAERRAHLDAGK